MKINRSIRRRFQWKYLDNGTVLLLDHVYKKSEICFSISAAVDYIATKVYGIYSDISREQRKKLRRQKLDYYKALKEHFK